MNLARIRTELAKLQELAAERARRGAKPLTIIILPSGDGPDPDVAEPLPRVAWRNHCAVCIVYSEAVGPPTAEAIGRLVEGRP